MDYVAELTAFTDWLEINPLEPTTQTLWFHLMAIANKNGCPEWFTVANPLLQAKVGVTENTLIKHRNYLVQKGRIEYKSQGKQKAGKYKIIYFTSINEVKPVVNIK
ncbi:Helix-turn-helix domain-containing protein [Fontibacillus panacisegetis]|uniref:Helix-turn-helix domain-containing protein n=1 Tax=Fontibacillus panacisegetis TaxID=670482 RepID=A0A1G7KEW1_9BACL|nr:helix-turn-helix domain-containing protein [Fontibacillus panacisegetis]SDF35732.1 Helix-turn-helix domain-containing protein [Fontibacillus panacisegetis]